MHVVSASRRGHHKARVHGSRNHVHAVLTAQLDDKTFEHAAQTSICLQYKHWFRVSLHVILLSENCAFLQTRYSYD